MSQPSLSQIQFKLYVLCFDDYVADAFTTGFVDAYGTRARWQAAVDTLYRLALSGLIKSPTFSDDRENDFYFRTSMSCHEWTHSRQVGWLMNG